MARLVVVSRNAALPFALNSAGHEVVVVEEDGDVRWTEYSAMAEVVLLDVDDPSACALLIEGLVQAARQPVWVLLLANRNPGWSTILEQQATGVHVLPLPLSMPRLAEALQELTAGPPLVVHDGHRQPGPAPDTGPEPPASPAPTAAPPSDAVPDEPAAVEPDEPAALDHADDVPVEQPLESSVVHLPAGPATPEASEPTVDDGPQAVTQAAPYPAEPAIALVAPEQPEPRPVQVAAPPAGPAVVQTAQVASARHVQTTLTAPASVDAVRDRALPPAPSGNGHRPPAAPAPSAELGWPAAAQEPPAPRATSLVRALTPAVDDLSTVRETAHVVLSEAMRVVPSDAGTVMVRDGATWRVSAGIGTRPLEERLTLTPEHWLVHQVSRSSHGVLLTGGQGRWSELYGAPLSFKPFLLAAPLPPLGAILLLARDGREFTEADLEALLPFCDEAGHLLSDAVDVRRLARLLSPFCDSED
ncbi:MAG: hypothetical protein WCD35_00960 [Mycobacteriales bacterium]